MLARGGLHYRHFCIELFEDFHQTRALGRFDDPGSDLILLDGELCPITVRDKALVCGREDTQVHAGEIQGAAVCPTPLRGGPYYMPLCADDLEMIVEVRERRLQAGAHAKPGFLIDRLRDGPAELKIICEHGFCILEITLLDGVHEGFYSLSLIHNVFLYYC